MVESFFLFTSFHRRQHNAGARLNVAQELDYLKPSWVTSCRVTSLTRIMTCCCSWTEVVSRQEVSWRKRRWSRCPWSVCEPTVDFYSQGCNVESVCQLTASDILSGDYRATINSTETASITGCYTNMRGVQLMGQCSPTKVLEQFIRPIEIGKP